MNLRFAFDIQYKLLIGFGAVMALFAIVTIYTFFMVNRNLHLTTRMTEYRQPTTLASQTLATGVANSLSALRGWILLGDPDFKKAREDAFAQQLDPAMQTLSHLGQQARDSATLELIDSIQGHLDRLKTVQMEVEQIAQRAENTAATHLLVTDIDPLGFSIIENLKHLGEIEKRLEATKFRKEFLAILADVQSSLSLALANLRSFDLTAEPRFRENFDRYWTAATTRIQELGMMDFLMSEEQKPIFKDFQDHYTALNALPERFFQLRSAPDWNVANHRMAVDIMPLAAALEGDIAELIHRQQELLQANSQEVTRNSNQLMSVGLSIALFGSLLSILFGYLSSRNIVRSAKSLESALEHVEHSGDLTHRIPNLMNDEIGRAGIAFNKLLHSLHNIMIQVHEVASRLGELANKATTISQSTADNMEKQEGDADYLNSAVTEMRTAIAEITTNAAQTAQATDAAKQDGSSGKAVVRDSVSAIRGQEAHMGNIAAAIRRLVSNGDRIGDIMDEVRAISDQTNLLALNAAIEAARAGEQGRGFAVVADEVRTLSQRTKDSLKEVDELRSSIQQAGNEAIAAITDGQQQFSQSITLAEQADGALDTIAAVIDSISGMTAQIASATEEQSSVISEVEHNVQTIRELTSDTAKQSRRAAAVAGELAGLAVDLDKELRRFQL